MMAINPRARESGNVFMLILLGVVLFASLSFFLARGMRSQTTEGLKGRKAELAATDILNYVQSLERGVNRLRQKNVSESDISFENVKQPEYAHTPVVTDAEKLFNSAGGAVSWQTAPKNVNDGSPWTFTGTVCISGVGSASSGCSADGNSRNEALVAVLSNMSEGVCTALNNRLGITGIPADGGGSLSLGKFTGAFQDGMEIVLPGGPFNSACFSHGGTNYFYSVLLAR